MTDPLPIEGALPALWEALDGFGAAVLVAEPGAGKTTVIPWRLLEAPWLAGNRIIMLEPRRVAARAAAARIAWHLHERVGETVGYRVRFDTVVSAQTRIEVVTEGVLTRLLQHDPSLKGYGVVILDEFHERSLSADLGLALTLQTRDVLRPDLRVLVMSATIDAPAVAAVLGGAPIIDAPGRVYPVETRFRPGKPGQRLEATVAAAVREAVAEHAGNVLVFLPGVGEIGRVQSMLTEAGPSLPASVLPLHGSLSPEQQDAVLAQGADRRIILSTSIAETSLTVPGVRIVIDGGQIRTPRFSPRTGMSRLETIRVTRASADQRRGRAGRTEPGVCYRLWSTGDDAGLQAHRTPEILGSDLASLALDLAAAGVTDPQHLRWLNPPPAAALSQARELLGLLGAIDDRGRLTPMGRAMTRLALHPRLAHMAVRAGQVGLGGLAAVMAVVLSDRDIARRSHPHELPDVDLRLRIDAIASERLPLGFDVDWGAVTRGRREVKAWRERLGVREPGCPSAEAAGRLLAWAYPDRIGQRRAGQPGRFLLRNGRGASMPPSQPLARTDYVVAAELDDAGPESRISIAAPLDPETIAEIVRAEGRSVQVVEWSGAKRSVRGIERLMLGALVIEERPVRDIEPAVAAQTALEGVRRDGLAVLPWSESAIKLRQRLACLHLVDATWPDQSDELLLEQLNDWLGGAAQTGDLSRIDCGQLLLGRLTADQRQRFDRWAPERYEVPTGSRIEIDYQDPAAPVLPVKLQEMFGETTTPRIADGRLAVTVHLLSPAGRPLQVTRDLAGFWRTSYFDVRREMKGRYPKHPWPENPLEATPTRRTKRRA